MARGKMVRAGIAASVAALALALAACSPQPSSPSGPQGSEGEPSGGAAVAVDWSPEADCMSCHTAEAESMGDATTLYSLHSQHATMNACIDCHGEDQAALAKAHENYMGEKARMSYLEVRLSALLPISLSGMFVLMLLSVINCLYTVETNPLSVTSHLQIFSPNL